MILVTDAQLRHSLALIRSLGKKGIPILAGDCERISTGFFSKEDYKKFLFACQRKINLDLSKKKK